MIRTKTKTALLSAVVLSSAFVAQSASAAIINTWNYNVDSTFSKFSSTDSSTGGHENTVKGSGGNAVLTGGPKNSTTLTWGDYNNTGSGDTKGETSSVSITSDVDSSSTAEDSTARPLLVTNDGFTDGATFTHNNHKISTDYSILDTFQITTRLNLSAADPNTGDNQTLGPITFDSFFTETLNQAPCVDGSDSVCDDIFVLTDTTAPGTDPLQSMETFTIDDYAYTVTLDLRDGVNPLTNDQCNAAGADDGCFGFLTQENNTNSFISRFNITAQQVPEPGTLAMLGLGLSLLGLGFFARRRDEDPMA